MFIFLAGIVLMLVLGHISDTSWASDTPNQKEQTELDSDHYNPLQIERGGGVHIHTSSCYTPFQGLVPCELVTPGIPFCTAGYTNCWGNNYQHATWGNVCFELWFSAVILPKPHTK